MINLFGQKATFGLFMYSGTRVKSPIRAPNTHSSPDWLPPASESCLWNPRRPETMSGRPNSNTLFSRGPQHPKHGRTVVGHWKMTARNGNLQWRILVREPFYRVCGYGWTKWKRQQLLRVGVLRWSNAPPGNDIFSNTFWNMSRPRNLFGYIEIEQRSCESP